MPQISRFYGIIILMNYKDHLPPHFHAVYNEYEIIVGIQDGEINKDALMDRWEKSRASLPLEKIEPLK